MCVCLVSDGLFTVIPRDVFAPASYETNDNCKKHFSSDPLFAAIHSAGGLDDNSLEQTLVRHSQFFVLYLLDICWYIRINMFSCSCKLDAECGRGLLLLSTNLKQSFQRQTMSSSADTDDEADDTPHESDDSRWQLPDGRIRRGLCSRR